MLHMIQRRRYDAWKDAYAMIECKRLSCTRNSRCLMHEYSLQLMLEQNTALELFTEGHK